VDKVDAEAIEIADRRLPFARPAGVNKETKRLNGNYLWISASTATCPQRPCWLCHVVQASSAGHGGKECAASWSDRRCVMIAIRSNFFYTRTVPARLWR
jgi:type I restriction enzyme M protein